MATLGVIIIPAAFHFALFFVSFPTTHIAPFRSTVTRSLAAAAAVTRSLAAATAAAVTTHLRLSSTIGRIERKI